MSDKPDDSEKITSENIFRITDELVRQVDRTKKMVLIMIIAVIIAVPVSWHVATFVKGIAFSVVGYTAIAVAILFVAIGVRQWRLLSKWTRGYKTYKVKQKKIDEKLDFEDDSGKGN